MKNIEAFIQKANKRNEWKNLEEARVSRDTVTTKSENPLC